MTKKQQRQIENLLSVYAFIGNTKRAEQEKKQPAPAPDHDEEQEAEHEQSNFAR